MLTESEPQSRVDLANRTDFLRVIETITMSGIFLLSAFGNALSCIIMHRNPRLRNWHNLLLFNVIITDLLVSVICMPFILVVLISGTWPLGRNLCYITAYLGATLVTVSITTLAAISISRYLLMKRLHQYMSIFKKRNVTYMIGAIWSFGFVAAFPPFVGWGKFLFLPGHAMCFVDFETSLSYGAVFTLLVIGLPLLVIIVCFVKVSLALRDQKRTEKIRGSLELRSTRTNSIGSAEIECAKSLLCVVVMVFLCWIPIALVFLLVAFWVEDIPRQVSLMSTFTSLLAFALKPLVYFYMKKEFRMELRKLCGGKVFSLKTKNRVAPPKGKEKVYAGES